MLQQRLLLLEQLLLQCRVLRYSCRPLLLLHVPGQTLGLDVLLDWHTGQTLWADAPPVVLQQLLGGRAPAPGSPSFC